jgi:FixJ family two-component response regulator
LIRAGFAARSVCRSYCRRTQRNNSRIGKDTFMVEMGSLHDASDAQQPHVPIVRVVDDDDKVRRSWQFVLEGEGWQVQAYESAVRFLQEDDPSIPGCIVCDVRMPEMSGIELQTEMKRTGNTMPLVLISAHADLVMAVKAVKDGAYDFLLKPVETERLIQTVSEALELDQTRREESAEDDRVRRSWDLLSAREKEVARGVADGKLNKQIAYDLNISEKTVIAHRSSLCRKLGIRSAADITRMLLTIEKLEKDQSKKETSVG